MNMNNLRKLKKKEHVLLEFGQTKGVIYDFVMSCR